MKTQRFLKDNKHRLLFKKTELLQRLFQFLFYYLSNSFSYLQLIILKLKYKFLVKVSSKSHIKNYCIVTGRARGIFREFKLSRIEFRKLGSQGWLFGLKKASW